MQLRAKYSWFHEKGSISEPFLINSVSNTFDHLSQSKQQARGTVFKKQTVSTGYYRIFSPIAGYKRCLRENVAISAEQSGVCRGIVGAFATSVYDRQSDCGTERRHDHRKHRAMPSVGRVTVWPFGARGRTDSALATSAHALVSDTLARPYDSVHESTPYHVTCISQRPSVSARQHWI